MSALLSRTNGFVAPVREGETTSIAVVICAYTSGRLNELVQAVDSVLRQSRPADALIVVIDHNDDLLAQARNALDGIRVLPSWGRRGLSGARNTGLAEVSCDVVAFLDDDAYAQSDWVQQLALAFDDERVMGASGWVEPSWETVAPRWLAPELYWIVGCSYAGLPVAGGTIRNGIGANMAFRRQVLADIGGFCEDIGQRDEKPLRNDDTDLGIRARDRHPEAEIVHVPAARVDHHVPEGRSSWRYLISRCWSEGRGKAILARSHGSSAALATEYRYIFRVLPAAIGRGLTDLVRGDPAGLARSASVIVALSMTAAGYLFGRTTRLDG